MMAKMQGSTIAMTRTKTIGNKTTRKEYKKEVL